MPDGSVVSRFCSWLVPAHGVVGSGREGWSFSGGLGQLRPGGLPGLVDWQVQHELVGGACEPAWDVATEQGHTNSHGIRAEAEQ